MGRVQLILDAYIERLALINTHDERIKSMLQMNNDPTVLDNNRLCEAISVVIQELYTLKRNEAIALNGGLKDEESVLNVDA